MNTASKLALMAPATAGGGAGLIYDSFTEATDTAVTSHTPDTDTEGGGWVNATGTWNVVAADDNVKGSNDNNASVLIDSGVEDHVLTCTVTSHDGGGALAMPGLVVRSDGSAFSTGDMLIVRLRFVTSMRLYKYSAGTGTELAVWGLSQSIRNTVFPDGVVWEITTSGNDITFDTPNGEDTNAPHTYTLTGSDATNFGSGSGHTHVGMFYNVSFHSKFDDFTVT